MSDTSTAPAAARAAAHTSIDMNLVGDVVRRLHDEVCGSRRRVEITRAEDDEVCVMISKRELEAIEHALAVLAGTDDFGGMCRKLHDLLTSAGVIYSPKAYGDEPPHLTFADELAGRV